MSQNFRLFHVSNLSVLLALVEPPRGAAGQRVPQAVGEGVVVAAEVVVEAAA